ncbi:MAG: hypothetical protein PHF56_17175, partial [Desulfuromonadaceae bacterium]|nr:hypothetical protein [Desulfuromonadaceae bacterium]
TVPISSLTATDNVGVTGYMVTESATAPAASASGWSASAPASFSFTSAGTKTAYAWAKDAAGNVSSALSAATNIILADTTAPTLSSFSLSSTSASLTVPISSLTATDNVGVTGYMVTESATAPAASASGWSASAPASFTFASDGTKNAYAWAKDAAGNVSTSRQYTTSITLVDTIAPTISNFTMPPTSTSLTVAVTGLSASDNIGVIGYLITESSTAPAASAIGWSASASTSFTFSSFGTKTAYAWAKDAAGNVSESRSATVNMLISSSISTVITTSTAVSAISISGISDPIICGIDFQVTYPSGTTFVNGVATPAGTSFNVLNIRVSDADVTIFGTDAFSSGEIARINYANIPVGSVSTQFSATILRVFNCSGVQIQ